MRTISVFFLLVISGSAWSQITITHSDFQKVWTVGSSAKTYSTPLMTQVSVFVGTASSSPQTWDYTSFSFSHVGTSIGIDPASAPFIGDFPEANAVLYGKMFYPGTDTLTTYQYQRLDTDKLSLYGLSDETAIAFSYDPPVLQAKIPLAYGVTWQQRDSSSFMPPYYTITESDIIVDAFGTLKLSSGTYECLRVTHHTRQINYTRGGFDTTLSRSHHFFTGDFIELNILSIDEAQFNQTTVDIPGISYSILDNAGYIGENQLISNSCTLFPCTPNPFQKTTRIRFHLSSPEMVSMKVFNNLGKEVSTLLDESLPAGQHEITFHADGLASGMYICWLKAGNDLQSIKLMLSK